MRPVSIVGVGQVPVQKQYAQSLRWLGATAVRQAMAQAGVDQVDALFAGNMLSDELQNQKHLAALIADEAGLVGIEALQIRAATGVAMTNPNALFHKRISARDVRNSRLIVPPIPAGRSTF